MKEKTEREREATVIESYLCKRLPTLATLLTRNLISVKSSFTLYYIICETRFCETQVLKSGRLLKILQTVVEHYIF